MKDARKREARARDRERERESSDERCWKERSEREREAIIR